MQRNTNNDRRPKYFHTPIKIKMPSERRQYLPVSLSGQSNGTQMYSPKTTKGNYDMVGTISYKLVILVELDSLERKRATVNVI
jgi:hypothetical protein